MKLFRLVGTHRYRYVEGDDVYPLSCPQPPDSNEEKFAEVRKKFVSNLKSDYIGEKWEEITNG